ncbi:MAG TPA: hypothetical protein DCR21_07170 [Succinivibrionaceae bacterium]|nr:hypothetical protein [Succinivibrionaceae bacterium]
MNTTIDYEMTVIVPVYNEQVTLQELLKSLEEYRQRASVKVCFMIVDDCSDDDSKNIILNWCSMHEHFFFLSLKMRSGLTASIKAGIDEVKSPFLGYIEANLQTDPEDFELLLKKRFEASLVCGERDLSLIKNPLVKLKVKLFNFIRKSVTRDGMNDVTCPLRVGDTQILKNLPWFVGMQYFVPGFIKATGHNVINVPVRYKKRIYGRSKHCFFKSIFNGVIDLMAFIWLKNRYIETQIRSSNFISRED